MGAARHKRNPGATTVHWPIGSSYFQLSKRKELHPKVSWSCGSRDFLGEEPRAAVVGLTPESTRQHIVTPARPVPVPRLLQPPRMTLC